MEPSDESSNKYHKVSKQDDGKFEEELPSSSRFFPYIEVKELPDIRANSNICTNEHKSQVTDQERIPRFGPSVSDDIFDNSSKEDLKVVEERERQLAAVRKRARHLKDAIKKGNEINLDMEDKQLEKIVAAIADVCELKVTVSGKELINTSDNKNKEMELASTSEFIEKAERAAMLMKRDNSALTAKVDKAEREKMKSNDTLTIYTNEAESEFTTKQFTEALSNIKADISNEKKRHEELQRRLRNLKTPSGSFMETNEKSIQINYSKRESNCGGLSKNGLYEMKSLRKLCLSPYHKLPPIPDLKSNTSALKYLETQRKLLEYTEPNKEHADLNSKSAIPFAVKQRNNASACTTMRTPGSTCWRPLESYPTNASRNKQHERNPDRSPPTTLSEFPLPLHTRARRNRRHGYNEIPFTCTVTNNWPTRSPIKTKAGIIDSSRTMSYEPMCLNRPEDVPIYVRKYRIHRRSRSVKLQAVSPTTGTPNAAVLPDFVDSCSPCTSP